MAQVGDAVVVKRIKHRQEHPQTSQQGGRTVNGHLYFICRPLSRTNNLRTSAAAGDRSSARRHTVTHAIAAIKSRRRDAIRRRLLPVLQLQPRRLQQLEIALDSPSPIIPQRHGRVIHRLRHVGQQVPFGKQFVFLVEDATDDQPQLYGFAAKSDVAFGPMFLTLLVGRAVQDNRRLGDLLRRRPPA